MIEVKEPILHDIEIVINVWPCLTLLAIILVLCLLVNL